MPGQSLEVKDVVALQSSIDSQKAPGGVHTVLAEPQLRRYKDLIQGNMHPEGHAQLLGPFSVEELFSHLRAKIFNAVELPEDFPYYPFEKDTGQLKHFGAIGILCSVPVDSIRGEVEAWTRKVIAEANALDVQKVGNGVLRFSPRGWFGGAVSVEIIETQSTTLY